MVYLRRTPGPLIATHVTDLWHTEDAPPGLTERFLPAGTLGLVVRLDEDEMRVRHGSRIHRHAGTIVSGAYRSSVGLEMHPHASFVAVSFRPGAAWPLLGVPPGELAGAHVDLAALWGARAAELRERLCAAAAPALRLAILEEALIERLAHARAGHPALPRAIAALASGGARVADVAADVGLSHRRLVDVFTAEVGIGPKAFARIARFREALARARREDPPDWAELALRSGYCDQSHLVREFVAIGGDSPTALLARSARRPVSPCGHHCRLA